MEEPTVIKERLKSNFEMPGKTNILAVKHVHGLGWENEVRMCAQDGGFTGPDSA